MHWTLPDLLALPVDVYEILLDIAPTWLSPEADDTNTHTDHG
jgi:hypothetical protein